MVGDLLRHFQLAAVLQIRRNAGRAEGVIANARFDTGRFRAPADDSVGVLLEEGIGCKLAGLAAGGAEKIAVDVIGDAGRFDIVVQTLGSFGERGNKVRQGSEISSWMSVRILVSSGVKSGTTRHTLCMPVLP
jgi:hypothetical protein